MATIIDVINTIAAPVEIRGPQRAFLVTLYEHGAEVLDGDMNVKTPRGKVFKWHFDDEMVVTLGTGIGDGVDKVMINNFCFKTTYPSGRVVP